MNAITSAAILIAVTISLLPLVHAQDMPLPKLLQGIPGGEKGRWKMEVLEGTGRGANRAGMSMTVCTDNVMDLAQRRDKDTGAASCRHKLVKDTADEAVVESECRERKRTLTMKRESDTSMLLTLESNGPRGPESMKMRSTRRGSCPSAPNHSETR
jgi:hypothetical protein